MHVTWRMDRRVWNLRSGRAWKVLRPAFLAGAERFGGRLVEFSVQGDHLHLIVEALDRVALGRALRALGIRIARALNRLMKTSGRVLEDRFHVHVLKAPREVRNAVEYVRHNHRKHSEEWGTPLASSWVDPFSSVAHGLALARPATWLLGTALRCLR
jgi:putative transposase